MKNILKKIGDHKREETALRKAQTSLEELMDQSHYSRACSSLAEKLKNSPNPAIIAEFKRQSPSKGIIRIKADPVSITRSYKNAGAAAISVLTDSNFFGAESGDFPSVREIIDIPILRKDFILEEYQVHETKAIGADIMLLIAAMLNPDEVEKLSGIARELGMDVLLELHSEKELGHYCDSVNLIGVNNRNLDTFEVDIENSKRLISKLPAEIPKVAESGLKGTVEIMDLYNAGFSAFLIGETFMKANDPGAKCKELIDEM